MRQTPVPVHDTQPVRARATGSGPQLVWVALAALAFAALVLVPAVTTGYAAGIRLRAHTQEEELRQAVAEQFELGVQDLVAGEYERARQRFEYILAVDPGNQDARELLDRALTGLNRPTLTPSPTQLPATPTPTLDLGSYDALLAQAQAAVNQGDWPLAIDALLALRARDPAYRRAEVNALFALALRDRGVQKILQGDQEEGIFDLSLAERFGPLDAQAAAWKRTAAFYLFANSYFGLDWSQAAANFASLCTAGVWDSCFKYGRAAQEYGHLLMQQGTPDPCAAIVQYDAALRANPNAALQPTATHAAVACLTATAPTPTATLGTETATPTPTATSPPEGVGGTPTATATATATEAPTSSGAP